ncbi:MAG TPA: GDP-mannose 4,6-dehydratase [Methylomirabilota bacterium]|nr:GDP-mannose 4,6-dehydratase [Methylomirabilota bacterium]
MSREASWKDRPVLVTGLTGFVGSVLSARLAALGARVVGLVWDELPDASLDRPGLESRVTVVRGSLEDAALLNWTVAEYEPEVVYHLGAQAFVETANKEPLRTFKANIEGTWNLLEACRASRAVRAVVFASSDKAYGSHTDLPYREDLPLLPQYPYDVSKACADLLARCYYAIWGVPAVVTRFANIYGPGDLNFSRLVPETVRAALEGRRPSTRSDRSPERDYVYIDDVVDLSLLLAERIEDTRGEAFNAGHGTPVRVLDLVRLILELAGRPDLVPEVLGTGTLAGEIDRQWLDAAKAKRVLGWQPRVGLEEGLRRTIAWYRDALIGAGRR